MSAFSAVVAPARSRLGLLLALPVLIAVVLLPSGTASAATAPVGQCNGILNQGGQAVQCHVTVANTLDAATGVGSSSVTVQQCLGAIGAPTCGPAVTTVFQDVVTSVTQCDGAASGGGGEVTCSVDITNDVTGGATPTAATVNQCIGSAGGGGTMSCSPPGATSSAAVSQCNGSGNGGGSNVTCTVAPSATQSASLQVTVDQCNGSANGGGSLVTCRTSITNHLLAAPVPATATPSASPTTTPAGTVAPTATPTSTPASTPTSTSATTPTATPATAPAPTITPSATSAASPERTATPVVAASGAPAPVGQAAGPIPSVVTVQARITPTTPTAPSLPRTGSDTGMLSLLGGVALAVGLVLLLAGYQPRGRHVVR